MNLATALSLDSWSTPELNPIGEGCKVNHICPHPDKERNRIRDPSSTPDVGVGARYQEVFVDLLSMKSCLHSRHSRYVLDPRFHNMLTDEDRAFKEQILEFMGGLTTEAMRSSAFETFKSHLQEYGYDSRYSERKNFVKSLEKHRKPNSGMPIISSPLLSPSSPPHTPSPSLPSTPSLKKPYPTPTYGHVFVANNSVCDMYCDAFLCPCEIGDRDEGRVPAGTIHTQFRRRLRNEQKAFYDELYPTDTRKDLTFEENKTLCFFKHWPFARFHNEPLLALPMPVLGEVGFQSWKVSKQEHLELLRKTLTCYFTSTVKLFRTKRVKPLAYRRRYLLALPVIGTGYGNAGDITGEVLKMLLTESCKAVKANDDLDVCIVCADFATFTHCQSMRRKMMKANGSLWPSFNVLNKERWKQAKELAVLAARGELSLFVGAGTSIASGGLSWIALLKKIESDFRPPKLWDGREGLEGVELLVADDLDELCEKETDKYGKRLGLKKRIAELTDRPFPSLLMCLLASLRTKATITQNYDTQAETSLENVNVRQREGRLSVIPYKPVKGATSWVLKMHGCVTAVDDIIITTSDFETFESSKMKALQGLVQSQLMTSHILIVGFSMNDPNYLRIIAEVRAALMGVDSSGLGVGKDKKVANKMFDILGDSKEELRVPDRHSSHVAASFLPIAAVAVLLSAIIAILNKTVEITIKLKNP
ncbi:hypothetical protein TrCOL_g2028 [Triparma columacea]|uniref:SIR2-like domain-containing protein n=1 Tax=Triparma columacea TaxID=722753 RepID=A0A9W7GAK3_9STRA|nr:hypothetical protein TrCOL_g2028 [Triparma columacea]